MFLSMLYPPTPHFDINKYPQTSGHVFAYKKYYKLNVKYDMKVYFFVNKSQLSNTLLRYLILASSTVG